MLPKTCWVHEPCLLRAREALLHPTTADSSGAQQFVTGLSFEEMRSAIGKSFSGIPGRTDGEPTSEWMLSDFHKESKVKDDMVKYIVSVPLYDALRRRKHLDVSIRTHDGEALESTACLWEYTIPTTILGRWWDNKISQWNERVLRFTLWRQGSLPEALVAKEWKSERNSWRRKADMAGQATMDLHLEHGPRHRHWYVNFVATNPDLQGHGYGSMILKKICELADHEQVDCFLDCSMEKNRRFYERFGFVVVGSRVLEGGGDDEGAEDRIVVYGMLRTCKE